VSRLDHAGAFGKASAAGGTRGERIMGMVVDIGLALLNLAAPDLFSACDLPGAEVLPHNTRHGAGAGSGRFTKRRRGSMRGKDPDTLEARLDGPPRAS
jgi:hypothetical protein